MSEFKGTPEAKGVFPPSGGWKENTMYIVDVAFTQSNVIHQSYFFSGYLTDGKPSGYNQIINPTYEEPESMSSAYYMKAMGDLPDIAQIFK
ncbi:hypothetical protein [[Curtobacterium] plantarum]|uniref:Uncharacterized protein n=1 Tax=[Curtobacterium] plantarum TaxID=221276 RepID=A0ABT9T6E7_9GAMM|nr:hypothetical protein [[Curtobacterium] plantarum]MDQ0019042.1 hypothetical protein [[Curtobacterium] plantarum]